MQTRSRPLNQQGFTLLELLSVMIIMSVLASVSIHRFHLLSDTAGIQAMASAISELNVRETLTWTNQKLSPDGWTQDADVFAQLDANLGSDYQWQSGPTISGGTLKFNSNSVHLVRNPSTSGSAGTWK